MYCRDFFFVPLFLCGEAQAARFHHRGTKARERWWPRITHGKQRRTLIILIIYTIVEFVDVMLPAKE